MNFLLRKTLDRSKPNRRDFMVQSTCAGLGITSAVNTLSQLSLVGAAAAAGGPSDFKALVCIFQAGGNDSNNLLIPGHSGSSMSTARTHYETGRGIPTYAGGAGGLAVPANELLATKLTLGSTAYDPAAGYTGGDMALHPACPEMAALFNTGALAMVANVGTLTATGVTRDNFNDALPTKPPQLFSHADQVLQWQSSISDQPFTSGWGGRIADLLNSSYNSGSGGLAMGVSIAGVNSFQVGLNNQAFVMSTAGSQNLYGYGPSNVGYANALVDTTLKPFISGPTGYDPLTGTNYKTTGEGWRLRALETVMEMNHANLFDGSHEATAKRARTTEGVVTDALYYTNGTGGPLLDSYFTAAFGNNANSANNDFANQMKMAARMIIGNWALLQAGKPSNTRQTFFLQQSGYDTHASQMAITSANVVNTAVGQYALLSTLSRSVSAFQQAILNHPSGGSALWASITAFSSSDFCRTFTPNKTDSTGGSDHGWGGNAFVVGGAVHGGAIYGTYPLLLVNDGIDCTGSRGRWIPTTSVDQYAAKIAAWFGVPAGSMATIFPNLGRFGGGTNLSFI